NTEKWVLPAEKTETELLTDEMKGMDKKDSIDFKPYLINVEALAGRKAYSVQVSYMGIHEDAPVLRAVFELIAHKTGDGFRFSSPLLRNTEIWKIKAYEHLTFHYQDTSVENIINQWAKEILEFDRKMQIAKPYDIYFCGECDDMACIFRLTGINYKLEMNGDGGRIAFFRLKEKDIDLFVRRYLQQQPDNAHDLFHWRAGIAISDDEKYNHYMVCGGAYVYGGSWEYSWEEIQKMFKARMKYDRKTDWLKLYFERYNFGESEENHLLITQFVNALIIQKVEKEQGFPAVMELLSSGNIYNDRGNFFRILEKVTGINEKNFNREVGKLIQGIHND
ncbi:MAG: hypothetical protein LBL57_11930, partial [Tannerella sp.]|nr:hypothetical protein [Tannerella sp.]